MSPPSPARVLLVIDKLGRAGAQRNLALVARGLDPRRYRAAAVGLLEGGALAQELRSAGVPVFANRGGESSPLGWIGALRLLCQARRRWRPHLLHSYLFMANALGALCAASDCPLVASYRQATHWRERPVPWIKRGVHMRARRILVNSSAVGAFAREVEGAPAHKLVLWPNPVAQAPWRPLRPRVQRVGCLANLSQIKGHDILIAAWARARLPGAELWLAGEGPLRAELQGRARALGVSESVRFLGRVAAVGDFLDGLDILVLASWSEGQPNALLEGMARGLPIVATAVGGVSELLADGACGRLVPPGDAAALAAALVELAGAADARLALGAAARERARREHDPTTLLGRLMDLYDQVRRA